MTKRNRVRFGSLEWWYARPEGTVERWAKGEAGWMALLYARTFGLLDALVWDLLKGGDR